MSMETQAIYAGHVDVRALAVLLESAMVGRATVRAMHKPDYRIIEVARSDESVSAVHVFLNSWAAEDYSSVFTGPSTFATVQYSPRDYEALRAVAVSIGGTIRKTTADPWVEVALAMP